MPVQLEHNITLTIWCGKQGIQCRSQHDIRYLLSCGDYWWSRQYPCELFISRLFVLYKVHFIAKVRCLIPYRIANTMTAFTDNQGDNLQPVCQNCATSTTPLWRRDEIGSVLCNACGLFLKLHGRPRPISLKTDVIKSRNRVKSTAQGPKKKVCSTALSTSTPDLEADTLPTVTLRQQRPLSITFGCRYTTTRTSQPSTDVTEDLFWRF